MFMPGLNHLDGTEVFNTTIDLEAEYNFVGKARIPNHSHVTFELVCSNVYQQPPSQMGRGLYE